MPSAQPTATVTSALSQHHPNPASGVSRPLKPSLFRPDPDTSPYCCTARACLSCMHIADGWSQWFARQACQGAKNTTSGAPKIHGGSGASSKVSVRTRDGTVQSHVVTAVLSVTP